MLPKTLAFLGLTSLALIGAVWWSVLKRGKRPFVKPTLNLTPKPPPPRYGVETQKLVDVLVKYFASSENFPRDLSAEWNDFKGYVESIDPRLRDQLDGCRALSTSDKHKVMQRTYARFIVEFRDNIQPDNAFRKKMGDVAAIGALVERGNAVRTWEFNPSKETVTFAEEGRAAWKTALEARAPLDFQVDLEAPIPLTEFIRMMMYMWLYRADVTSTQSFSACSICNPNC